MYVSFYDNQEAMERSYLLFGLLACLVGFPFIGLLLFAVGFQAEDEERTVEDELLDAGEPTLHYAITLQRDRAAEFLSARDGARFFGFAAREREDSDFVEEYVAEDFL